MKIKGLLITLATMIIVAITGISFLIFWNDYGEISVTEDIWVNVVNLNGIKNLNSRFEFMDSGLITKGSKIKRVAEYENQILVRYITPSYSAAGTEVPEGTIFFISKDKFIKMTKGK